MAYPIATEVTQQYVAISDDKVANLVAEEQIKLMKHKVEKEEDEIRKLYELKRKMEEKRERQQAEQDEIRRDNEWRINHPFAARERDKVQQDKRNEEQRQRELEHQRQERTKDAEAERKRLQKQTDTETELVLGPQRYQEKIVFYKTVGVAMIGAGSAILIGLSFL